MYRREVTALELEATKPLCKWKEEFVSIVLLVYIIELEIISGPGDFSQPLILEMGLHI